MEPSLPGEMSKEEKIERILRVDQAGEFGAKRIYAGQLAVLGHGPSGDTIRHMAEQEEKHLQTFNDLLNQRHVRPTLLSPVWHVAGFALGAGTALLGEKAAMACTEAVEEVIDEHYQAQVRELESEPAESELRDMVEKFREEEVAHKEKALAEGAEEAPGYPVLSSAIKAACRLAIRVSEKV